MPGCRTLTAVLASLYQPLDMRETRLGLGLLSLQAGMVHLLAVSISRKAVFAIDALVVVATLGFSVILLPVLWSGVSTCPCKKFCHMLFVCLFYVQFICPCSYIQLFAHVLCD